ncbi:MAG TPA: TlpA disulfide reductase family protein [Pirellulales bacterium]|nr:TlpA disulfide reductase family protein [Pirellulales bacterium]
MPLRFSSTLCLIWCLSCFAAAAAADDQDAKPAKKSGTKYEVPQGTPEELLAFIRKQQRSQGRAETRTERLNSCQAIVTAAERIRKEKADDETLTEATKAELDALTTLKRLDDDDAAGQLDSLTEQLKNDKRPAIVHLVKTHALMRQLDTLDASDAAAVERFATEVEQLAGSGKPDVKMVPLAKAATVLLHRSGKHDAAAEAARKFAEKFAQADAPDVLVGAAQMANLAGQILELEGREKEAGKLIRDFADRLAKSDDSDVREAAKPLESWAFKLELIGKPMSVSGKLLEGGKFELSQYKGKVVLVDFWATWCGPCVAELPNVKDVYAKYHDRGFEVVGISLDNDADALSEFVKERHIAWPVLFEGGENASGWGHPLAEQYKVDSIPLAILLDRQGKVVSLHARAKRLGELVGQLIEGGKAK